MRTRTIPTIFIISLTSTLLAGCGGVETARVSDPAPPTARAADPEEHEAESALPAIERAAGMFEDAGIELGGYHLNASQLEKVLKAGMTEQVALEIIEEIASECLATNETCDEMGPLTRSSGQPMATITTTLQVLEVIGTDAMVPLMLKLDARGVYQAGGAIDALLRRKWEAEGKTCAPHLEAATAARADLDGFVVLQASAGGKGLEAMALDPVRADDLAYLLAAMKEAGQEVGTADGASGGWFGMRWGTMDSAKSASKKAAAQAMGHAAMEGDAEGILNHGIDYLKALGYPGPLRTSDEDDHSWGGARFSYVMRDVARAAELTGRLELAGALYRRANPGGGACGTSVSSMWSRQVKGLIRTAERSGKPCTVVAERLLGIDGPLPLRRPSKARTYGPYELQQAGFDVARLYQGSLLTINRDAERASIERALSKLPRGAREAATARLEAKGLEAWDARIHGVEGFGDAAKADGLETLMALAQTGTPDVRRRAIATIGNLAERPEHDLCAETMYGFGGSWSSQWSRKVGKIGVSCETALPKTRSAALSKALIPFLDDKEREVRESAVKAIEHIASPVALPRLVRLKNSTPACRTEPDGTRVCDERSFINSLAEEAITHINEVEKNYASSP